MFEILNENYDNVIKSKYLTVVADYDFALHKLVPLIDKLDFQRSTLRKSFYSRLENDIVSGCIMPFLTIAISKDANKLLNIEFFNNRKAIEESLVNNLDNAFVLDGIQRLNTLKRVEKEPGFDGARPIFFNILICESMDKLLYRMVTLNNGQKPMTARHQIEVLANNIFDFDSLPIIALSEKHAKTSKKNKEESTVNKEVLIKAYIAYISNSVNIDNQKIIESKMDELITDQIMSSDITDRNLQYHDVIEFINNCLNNEYLKEWFAIPNNFIGFSAAMSKSFNVINDLELTELEYFIEQFEEAFSGINISKIKIGMARRRMVQYFLQNYEKLHQLNNSELLDKISLEL